ncbi:hypothetical protein AB1Y20_012702 [Prymnesium parvum]|uniref:RING-type E3 ubiquitin transferase n=1 Tax=Prymnesium parvum TaxID=97485 RepID=A0AB34IJ45_PRYPA
MHEPIQKIEGVGAGINRIFAIAGMKTVFDLHKISTREENTSIVEAAMSYVREKFPGLNDDYYVEQHRRMRTRCINVAIRVQEGKPIQMEIPDVFQCPLSYDWLVEPVMTPSWQKTYSRSEITRWIERHHTDPSTGAALTVDQLIPNRAMADAVEFYRRQNTRISIMC